MLIIAYFHHKLHLMQVGSIYIYDVFVEKQVCEQIIGWLRVRCSVGWAIQVLPILLPTPPPILPILLAGARELQDY